MKAITVTYIKDYINNELRMGLRHDAMKMKKAINQASRYLKIDPIELFHFIIENKDVTGKYYNSYGFNTAEGRAVKEYFQELYYSY